MTKEEIYRALARLYNYTPEQIANMTFYQQKVLLTDDTPQVAVFNNLKEFTEWKMKRG